MPWPSSEKNSCESKAADYRLVERREDVDIILASYFLNSKRRTRGSYGCGPGLRQVAVLIEQLTLGGAFALSAVCSALEVSRAGYYAWLGAARSLREQQDRQLIPLIHDIFWQHKRRYGARRIAVEMQARGQPCGVDRVEKLLKMQGLKAIQPQTFKP